MIYLFEDKEGRMAQYLNGKVDGNLLKRAVMMCTRNDDLDEYISNHFGDADAILFHVSYVFPDSGIKNDAVRNAFLKKGVPFIYFSGASNNNISRFENGTAFADVRSSDMYANLPEFISRYGHSGKVNIPFLVYGKGYLKNSLLGLQAWASEFLWNYDSAQPLNIGVQQMLISGINSRIQEEELQSEKESMLTDLKAFRGTDNFTPAFVLGRIQAILDRN